MTNPSVGRTPDSRQSATRDAVLLAVFRMQLRNWNNQAIGTIDQDVVDADNDAVLDEFAEIGLTSTEIDSAIHAYNALLLPWMRRGYRLTDDQASA